jgi:serine/threonine protein kinase
MEPTRLAERYELVRPLGRGSFAQTLLARDLAHDRLVAIKMLQPRVAQRWDPGTELQILYLPDDRCERLVISTS